MRIRLTALALTAILPLTAAHAVGQDRSSRHGQHWLQELNLTEQQRRQFEEKRKVHRAEQQQLRKDMQQRRLEQSGRLQAQRDRQRAELRSLLTPEQLMAFNRQQERKQYQSSSRFGQPDKRNKMQKKTQKKYKKQRQQGQQYRNKEHSRRSYMHNGRNTPRDKQQYLRQKP